jgi:hypothetical protein
MPKDQEKQGLPVLRTFKSDSSQYIKKEGISMVDVATAQVKRGFGSFVAPGASLFSTRNIILASAVIVLVGAGIGAFAVFGKKEAAPLVVVLPKPVLTSDFEKETTLPDLLKTIKEPVKENKLLYIAVVEGDGQTKKLVTIKELFDNFGIAFPGDTTDIFEGSFMLSIYGDRPSLIFKIKSYEKTFVAMMKWEEKMADDLSSIFMINDTISAASSFMDKEIRNHDARILNDSSGASIIAYSFVNKDYLVVSSGEDALGEIIRRFSLPQYLNQ